MSILRLAESEPLAGYLPRHSSSVSDLSADLVRPPECPSPAECDGHFLEHDAEVRITLLRGNELREVTLHADDKN